MYEVSLGAVRRPPRQALFLLVLAALTAAAAVLADLVCADRLSVDGVQGSVGSRSGPGILGVAGTTVAIFVLLSGVAVPAGRRTLREIP